MRVMRQYSDDSGRLVGTEVERSSGHGDDELER